MCSAGDLTLIHVFIPRFYKKKWTKKNESHTELLKLWVKFSETGMRNRQVFKIKGQQVLKAVMNEVINTVMLVEIHCKCN